MPDNDLLGFLPIIAQSADDVRARFNADANAGLDPSDPDYTDTTEGGWFWDNTQGAVLEATRLWDFVGTELPAAAFPATAWGDYLDRHGATLGLERLDAVFATGSVFFTGTTGTLIPAGTQVSTQQPDPAAAQQPVQFQTDRTITLAATPGPAGLAATPSGSGGTLPAGVYYYMVTAIGASGETIGSNEVSVTLTGATSSVALSWTAVAGATAYRIYRGQVTGLESLLASPAGTSTAYSDTGSATPTPTTIVPTNAVSVTALVAGTEGNVASGAVTQVASAQQGIASVTNASPMSGGADLESDQRFAAKISAEYAKAGGAGTISDYVKWSLEVPQVGYVTVQPLWNGSGTVRVIINDASNHPVSASIVQVLQTKLDPVPQQGHGDAPIGALVTVATTTLQAVAVVATLTFLSGYSLDGAGGTIPTRQAIVDALDVYLNGLSPGQPVILNAVIRQIMSVPGILDVHGPGGTGEPTLNGSAANVTLTALQVASAGTITLS